MAKIFARYFILNNSGKVIQKERLTRMYYEISFFTKIQAKIYVKIHKKLEQLFSLHIDALNTFGKFLEFKGIPSIR